METSRNPFDDGKSDIGLGNKKRLTPTQKERQSQLKRIDQEDEDIKRELRKENILNILYVCN